jgi:hypothetical protein
VRGPDIFVPLEIPDQSNKDILRRILAMPLSSLCNRQRVLPNNPNPAGHGFQFVDVKFLVEVEAEQIRCIIRTDWTIK